MARESIKARERKRERMVAKYAHKRAELKAAGDYEALDKLPKKCFTSKTSQSLQTYRPSERIYEKIWHQSGYF